MIADVPLGAFLSGGVDSSAIVATMARLSPDPVNTCSMSFDDPAFDESRYAQMVANRYRTRHFTERVASDDFDLIDHLAGIYDEPYADSSAIPTYRVCQLARKHVTVALSGDGGDESFGGYRRYRMHCAEERWRSLMPLELRRPVFGVLGQRLSEGRLGAPRISRQDHISGAGSHHGRSLPRQRLDHSRAGSPGSSSHRACARGSAGIASMSCSSGTRAAPGPMTRLPWCNTWI